MLFNQYLNKGLDPVEKFQECRNSVCESGQICNLDKDNYITCRDCGTRTCIGCDALWHPDQSCDERRASLVSDVEKARRDAEAAKDRAFLDTNCKCCPRCDRLSIKDGGCDHVICKFFRIWSSNPLLTPVTGPFCGHQYCWGCLADYAAILREDKTRHRTDCPYRSENLPNPPEGLVEETWDWIDTSGSYDFH